MNQIRKLVIQNYVQSYNSFDMEGLVVDLHDQIVFENIHNEAINLRIEGIDNFLKQAREAKTLFEHRTLTPTHWNFDRDEVTVTIEYSAKLAREIMGLKKGDQLKLAGQSVFHFRENEIIKIIDKS